MAAAAGPEAGRAQSSDATELFLAAAPVAA